MGARVTIKDIAQKAGVTPGTVHRALNGKGGVGDACREKILDIARREGYRPNSLAASLKRKNIRLAVAFPGPQEKNRFFYTYVWQGFRDYVSEIKDFNIDIIELPYYSNRYSQSQELLRALERYGDTISGLLTVGHVDPQGESVLARYIESGIPVMLACNDVRSLDRLCCVQPNYEVAGGMVAEQLIGQVPEGSEVVICAGDILDLSHNRVVQGFEEYIRDSGDKVGVVKIHGYDNQEDVRQRLRETLMGNEKISGAFSVNARSSVVLAEEIVTLGLKGKLRAIGSDIFDENIENLKKGILTNIIYKDPRMQSYMAAKLLCDYLIKNERPGQNVLYVRSSMIYKSNLCMYESEASRAAL